MDPERVFADEYVPNVEGSAYHPKWVSANKNGDAPKWAAFRDAAKVYKEGQPLAIPTMATKYGKALVAAGKLHMSVIDLGSVWVPPTEPPPTGTVTNLYQLSSYSIGWNRFQDLYQGDPTATSPPYTAWPNSGGIHPVTTPHGPGLHYIVTPAMLYQSTGGDSKMARLSWGTGDPNYLGFNGKAQVWQWYWNLPSANNASGFPSSGLGPGELFLLRTTNSDGVGQPGYVGHGFNLGFAPQGLVFQHFRSLGSNTFEWTWGPTVNLDQWYKFRWEIKHTSGSDGYIRAYTDDVRWVNYSGPTIMSNQQTQLVFCSLRNTQDRTNGIIYANMTMTQD